MEPLDAGVVVEISPVIVLSEPERTLVDQTRLHDYVFEWGENGRQCCVALGYISIYNHAFKSNCEYEMDFENGLIRVTTVSEIDAGSELFINYNGDWDDPKPLWFEAH